MIVLSKTSTHDNMTSREIGAFTFGAIVAEDYKGLTKNEHVTVVLHISSGQITVWKCKFNSKFHPPADVKSVKEIKKKIFPLKRRLELMPKLKAVFAKNSADQNVLMIQVAYWTPVGWQTVIVERPSDTILADLFGKAKLITKSAP